MHTDRGVIRRVRHTETGQVSSLIQNTLLISNSLDYDIRVILNLSRQYSHENVREMAARREMYVHLSGSAIDGTVSLKGNTIYAFFVAPDKQGSGIGTRLLAYVEDVAERQGRHELTVDASITAADFYATHGYRIVRREWNGSYGTVITMKKSL